MKKKIRKIKLSDILYLLLYPFYAVIVVVVMCGLVIVNLVSYFVYRVRKR